MTKGLDQILSRLNELQVKAPKAARAAVGEGADEVEKILKVYTPVYFILDGVHAKDVVPLDGGYTFQTMVRSIRSHKVLKKKQ